MGKIRQLDADLINKIAAGEVIESAHSVIKELVENSIDAGASEISIETKAAGLDLILIKDNGSGILEEDLSFVAERHATSKIKDLPDLDSVLTYGFRGEAVASIASVSRLVLESGTEGERFAHRIEWEKGEIVSKTEVPHFQGTKFEVRDLFFNTPVRRKFLKSELAEERKNKTRVQISALARPDVSFRFVQNGKEIFRCSGESLEERIYSLFGENLRDHLMPVQYEKNGIKVQGFISDPDFYRSNRSGQFFFVNNRPIEIKHGSFLLKKCYDELLPPGAHPWCFLFFEISPDRVDINVHPQKREIRFLDEEFFSGFLIQSINRVLRSSTPVSFLELKRRLSTPIRAKSSQAGFRFSSTSGMGEVYPGTSGFGSNSLPGNSREALERDRFLDPGLSSNRGQGFQSILHRDIFPLAEKREAFSMDQTGPGSHLDHLTQDPTKHPQFLPKRHFGILFETFILAEAEDGLYIIDQHTAHERIRYEEVLNQLKKKSFGIQPLLVPIRVDFSRDEANEIWERRNEFSLVGIHLEMFGEESILIREVPGYLDPGQEKDTVLDFMERSHLPGVEEPELYDLMAKCVACRSSIRKGSQVSDTLISEILNRLSYTENPARCPHGRPTLVKLTRDDLEKMFHRK